MKIIVKVLDVQTTLIRDKETALVTMMSGHDVIQARLWNAEYLKGTHKQAEKVIGQPVVVDVMPELYNDKLNYGFGYAPTFIPVTTYFKQFATPTSKTATG